MRWRVISKVVLVGSLVALAACGPTDDGGTEPGAGPTEPTDPGGDEELDVQDGDIEAAVVADAAARAEVDPDEVVVVTHEQVTWSDGSLGCPDPDQFYTQALVEGYRVIVEAGGQTLHYHGQQDGPPSYCADPQDPADMGGTVDR